MPLDPQIPLSAMGADPRQAQQQFQNGLQVFQMKDQMQQRDQAQMAAANEKLIAQKVDTLANSGTTLFLKYRGLIDQGFSEASAHAAMQEDFKRELGGLAASRTSDGKPLFAQEELQGFGQEFNAGEL